jgi:hypothetical protein
MANLPAVLTGPIRRRLGEPPHGVLVNVADPGVHSVPASSASASVANSSVAWAQPASVPPLPDAIPLRTDRANASLVVAIGSESPITVLVSAFWCDRPKLVRCAKCLGWCLGRGRRRPVDTLV